MANLLSDKEQRSLENKKRWAEREHRPNSNLTRNAKTRDLKERLLDPNNGNRVLAKVLEVALDNNHPGQMAALKMCLDRMLPISNFEEVKGGVRTAIQISISGLTPKETIDV